MKKVFFIITLISGIVFTSCGNTPKENNFNLADSVQVDSLNMDTTVIDSIVF